VTIPPHPLRFPGRALLAALFLLALAAAAGADDLRGRVEWVYDGDTIRVAGVGKVRLIGIDTPEHEAGPRDRFFVKLGGNGSTLRRVAGEALRFNIEQTKGREVRLTTDRQRRDGYGRLLAYVALPDGRLLNRLLLEKGYAVVYRRFDFARKEDFLAAEAQAKRQGAGLWGR